MELLIRELYHLKNLRQSDAQEKFENSKFELSKSLMILELVTHTPILRNK